MVTRRSGRRSRNRSDLNRAEEASLLPLRNRLGRYEPLAAAVIDAIEVHTDRILDEIGVEFRGDEEALELFRSAGARVDGERVRFDPGLAASLCGTAPPRFEMYGRSGPPLVIGGDRLVFLPAYGPPFVTDLDRGRRYATMADFEDIVRLTYATPWLHHSGGTVCEPVDVPVNKRHLDMTYAHLRWSTKPFMGAVTSPERASDSIAMARLVFGADFMDSHCVIQGNINVNSPLVWDDVMSGSLKAYARANQGCVISPFIIGGAMGPVTIPALVAQAHAEAMSGIALSQLVKPGAPVVYGNFLTTMNLRSGAPTFGTAESTLATYAIGQLARRLGLPLRCGGHYTASKIADGQAMQESADAMTAGILAGTNYVIHAAGWLEGGLAFGYEKFAMDLDRCAMLHKQLAGLEVDDEQLAMDAFAEAGPGGNYLGSAHTLRHYATANHESMLADTNSFEQWTEDGALDVQQRANRQWKTMLAEYEPPPIDDAVERELRAFVDEHKARVPDSWY
ncbi:MAG: trimethylamine methyltransferase family protein [Acidimicrobiales bacterium]|nr:trimethylamine methyltransferase family protein [Acidimicrobiales bacterium]